LLHPWISPEEDIEVTRRHNETMHEVTRMMHAPTSSIISLLALMLMLPRAERASVPMMLLLLKLLELPRALGDANRRRDGHSLPGTP
jgi:hypothetical protein